MRERTGLIRQFRQSVRRGTGKAYLLIRDNSNLDYSAEIIKACIKNFSYDGQCESSRAGYLYGLIKQSNKIQKIKNVILDALQNEISDTWTLTQLFDLAKHFALDGDREAKEAIYSRFYNKIIHGSDWVGAYEIIELDGLPGLTYIADKMGASILADPEDWQDDSLINKYNETNKGHDGFKELSGLRSKNKNIGAYLDSITETVSQRELNNRNDCWSTDILEDIQKCKVLYGLIRRRGITEEEQITIANAFLSERDVKMKIKYLQVFTYIKFPLDSAIILHYAKKDGSPLKEYAIKALTFITNDEIREFALENISAKRNPYEYTNILISNYKTNDNNLLLELIEKTNNDFAIEELANSFVKIYTQNATRECQKPMEAAYRKMTCGLCRAKVIETLYKNNSLPDNIREEIQFDSNEDVKNILNGTNE